MRANLTVDYLTGGGRDEVRTARALVPSFWRVLILNRLLGYLLLRIGSYRKQVQQEGSQGETHEACPENFPTRTIVFHGGLPFPLDWTTRRLNFDNRGASSSVLRTLQRPSATVVWPTNLIEGYREVVRDR